jgi:patatin-like phospholipase/acyl hydrolase
MNILSLDGGGIRGIIPGMVLVAFEKKLQQIKNNPNLRLADVFDLIAGTSTGGILTCLYLCPDTQTPPRPRFSALEAVNLYLQNGDNIFDVSLFRKIASVDGLAEARYSAGALEKVLADYLGDLRLSQLLKPCLITTYDMTARKAKFFNQEDTDDGTDVQWDFYLRDVARATSAAPTYFEPANITALDRSVYACTDGGVFANNPAMCACVEAFGYDAKLNVTDLNVLSLGTGTVDQPYHYSEAKNWGKLSWVEPVLDIMMSGMAETVDYQLKMLFKAAGVADQYLRLQVDLRKHPEVDSAMDNATEPNMRALETVGQELAMDNDAALTVFANKL